MQQMQKILSYICASVCVPLMCGKGGGNEINSNCRQGPTESISAAHDDDDEANQESNRRSMSFLSSPLPSLVDLPTQLLSFNLNATDIKFTTLPTVRGCCGLLCTGGNEEEEHGQQQEVEVQGVRQPGPECHRGGSGEGFVRQAGLQTLLRFSTVV